VGPASSAGCHCWVWEVLGGFRGQIADAHAGRVCCCGLAGVRPRYAPPDVSPGSSSSSILMSPKNPQSSHPRALALLPPLDHTLSQPDSAPALWTPQHRTLIRLRFSGWPKWRIESITNHSKVSRWWRSSGVLEMCCRSPLATPTLYSNATPFHGR
jgi:hypothetical protein